MEIEDLANAGKMLRFNDKNDDVKLYKTYLKTKAGAAFITIDIPSVKGLTFRSPHNLRLVKAANSANVKR